MVRQGTFGVKFVKYAIFCILVLVTSILIRRPAEVLQEEITPVEKAETGAEMMKGQKPSITTASDEEEVDEDEDDDDEDEDYRSVCMTLGL